MRLSRRRALLALGTPFLALPPGLFERREARSNLASDPSEFLQAVIRGETGRVRDLLIRDPSLATARDGAGRSALILALVNGHEDIAMLLRVHVESLDIVEAVLTEEWDRVEALAKDSPALCNAAHPIGGTPLYAAALGGTGELWRLRSLGCRSDEAPSGGTGLTPARGAMNAVSPVTAFRIATDLLGNGADVNARQARGDSILHGAVLRRDPRLVRLVLRKGADVTFRDDRKKTAAELAKDLEWEEGVRLLTEAQALPKDHRASRFKYDAQKRPLRRVDLSDIPQELQSQVTGASHGNLPLVRELVGRDPRLVFSISTDAELAIEACAHTGHRALIRFHLDHGAPLSLPTAVALNDREFVRFLLDEDPLLVHERGAHDFPVMHYVAFGGGSLEMAELLRGRGVSPDQETSGTTALHWCARRNQEEFAKWLLERGAAVNAVGYAWDRRGQTPLVVAQKSQAAGLVKILKDAGGRI